MIAGATRTAHANEIQSHEMFESWTSATCSGEGSTCVFAPFAATLISAKFKHHGGGGGDGQVAP